MKHEIITCCDKCKEPYVPLVATSQYNAHCPKCGRSWTDMHADHPKLREPPEALETCATSL